MENNIPWLIIIKSFKKEATQIELSILNDWLEDNEINQIVLTEIFNVYKVSTSIPGYLVPDKKKAWKKIEKRIGSPDYRLKNFSIIFKYTAAAVITLLISFTFFWIYNSNHCQYEQQFTEVIAPMGQKTMIVLPDSSLVSLNSGSSLKYNGNFNKKNREVILDGEAFFDVKKNDLKRFKVKTGILFVDVYGTEFNIKNFEDDKFQEITVIEGKVGLSDNFEELKQLTTGQQAVLDKNTGKLTFLTTKTDVVTSWKNNELNFDNTPLIEVIKYLERWYGVKISIHPAMIGKHNYTFKIKTESLTEILEKINIITPLTYEIEGKDVKIRYINKN